MLLVMALVPYEDIVNGQNILSVLAQNVGLVRFFTMAWLQLHSRLQDDGYASGLLSTPSLFFVPAFSQVRSRQL